mmetsp:Transcript_25392/g.77016  ORF Transcript_25392/g.77016 Transcript_25392/m.77016 type:complete len:102 (+) Transcript_25392:1910-2215(+)|eukprot:scaffold174389_cov29-Tisochrysis_lutea.AAC.2
MMLMKVIGRPLEGCCIASSLWAVAARLRLSCDYRYCPHASVLVAGEETAWAFYLILCSRAGWTIARVLSPFTLTSLRSLYPSLAIVHCSTPLLSFHSVANL